MKIVIPDDYQEFEDETGARLAEGWWWWRVLDDGTPHTSPIGPFGTSLEALAEWEMAAAWEPWCE